MIIVKLLDHDLRCDLIEADDLRRSARRERDRRMATRILAVVNALESTTWAEAARLAKLRQAWWRA